MELTYPVYGRHKSDSSTETKDRAYLLAHLPHASDAHLALLYREYMDNVGSGYWPDVMNEIQSRGLTLDDVEELLS